MSYQVKRSKKITETLELVDAEGKIVEVISIDLDVDTVARQISKDHIELVKAGTELQEISKSIKDQENPKLQEMMEKYGNAVIKLFNTVFGEENTTKIVNFYENRYVEMSWEVTPFVVNVVLPRVREVAQSARKEVIDKYNRKERRRIGVIHGIFKWTT